MSPRPVDPARRVAYDVVLAVELDDAYANLVLPRLLRERGLVERDAAFATELCYGTLRWQGVLDQVVAAGSTRPVAALDPSVRALLRVGSYQLLRMRVPTHAAVHATVELTRATAGEKVVRFVNAVLRRVGERDWDGWVDRLAPTDDIGRAAFAAGYPGWVAVAFLDALDGDADELRRAMAEDRPVTHLVARPGLVDRDALLGEAGDGATPGPWSPYAVRLSGGDPAALPSVRSGAAAAQDEGSQLMALALARAPVDGPDLAWLDLCAGPGGKAGLLAGLRPEQATLVAADVQPHRAALVRRAVGDRAAVLVADGTRPAWAAGRFDRVIVDAPCTGLGALRRRPEVRWRRTAGDVGRLVVLQRRLLESALGSVRPGGVVAYVTCSPHRDETTGVVDHVLASRPEVERLDARTVLPGVPSLGAGPDVQLWSHRHGTDGMYLALLRSGYRRADPDL